jgi:hypothetical protein
MHARKVPCRCANCSSTPQGFLLLSKHLHSKHQEKYYRDDSEKVKDFLSKISGACIDYMNSLLPVRNLEMFPGLSVGQEYPRISSVLLPQAFVNLKYLRFEQWCDDSIPRLRQAGKLDTDMAEKSESLIEEISNLHVRVIIQILASAEHPPPMNLTESENSNVSSLEYLEWEISTGIKRYRFPLPLHFLQKASSPFTKISQEIQLDLPSYLGLDPLHSANISTIQQLRWVRAMLQQVELESQFMTSTNRTNEFKEGLKEYLGNMLTHVKSEKFRQDNPGLDLRALTLSIFVHLGIYRMLIFLCRDILSYHCILSYSCHSSAHGAHFAASSPFLDTSSIRYFLSIPP